MFIHGGTLYHRGRVHESESVLVLAGGGQLVCVSGYECVRACACVY